jgi:hypothetical protein
MKTVRLEEGNKSDNMMLNLQGFGDTLERFSSRSCEYNDVVTLAKNCNRLRCLDISSSEGISFRVVDYI